MKFGQTVQYGLVFALTVLCGLTVGCSLFSSSSKKKEPAIDPEAAVVDSGLTDATQAVMTKMKNTDFFSGHRGENRRICFLGVTDAAGREVPGLTASVRQQISRSTEYTLIDEQEFAQALEKSEVKPNDVYLPDSRDKWMAELKNKPDYILSARLIQTGGLDNQTPVTETVSFEIYSIDEKTTASIQNPLRGVYSVAEDSKFLGIF